MSFLDPGMLWALLLVPLLGYGYARLVRARAERRAALGTMGTAWGAAARAPGWRRHVPIVLFLIALAILCVAMARPVATLELPRREGTVILAFDVSSSMTADDLAPNRLEAAQRAARRFVERQPESIEVGVVAFSTAAFEVLPPTENRVEVLGAIDRLDANGATSLSRGIFESVNAIAGRPVVVVDPTAVAPPDPSASGDPDESAPVAPIRVPFLGSSAIVLLSDGEDTTGVDPLGAADVASRAGVRVFTVGIGSEEGAVIDVGGTRVATRLDEASLRAVAEAANGRYLRAADAGALTRVYDEIDLGLTLEPEETEITAILAAGALVILLLAAACSYRWLGRVP